MPPAIFKLVALLIAVFSLATAAFPRQMSQWQMRSPDGTATIEPSGARLLMMRLMAFGNPALLF